MNLRGGFVEIMFQVHPEYDHHVRYENGKKFLYILVFRDMYGYIESTFLWYNIFSTNIEGLGFVINTYDRCAANKVIEGTPFPIAWYVDDNNLLHKNLKVISDIINEVNNSFGDI